MVFLTVINDDKCVDSKAAFLERSLLQQKNNKSRQNTVHPSPAKQNQCFVSTLSCLGGAAVTVLDFRPSVVGSIPGRGLKALKASYYYYESKDYSDTLH